MAKPTLPKFELPIEDVKVRCRACGYDRDLDQYRMFSSEPLLHMDFCVDCEAREGTVTLYRRFNAYGTKAIIDAVFVANRVPVARRTPDQVRLLVEGKPDSPPANNEDLLQREMARRELCRRRLLYFTTTMMPAYKPGWVHQDICRRLEKFVRDVEEGKSPRLMLAMPPRSGKLLAHSTPVLTPTGWTTHGALQPGDEVYHPSGAATKIVAVSPDDLATMEVELSNGDVIKAHPAHEWTVYDRSRGAWRTVDTAYLASQTLHSGPEKARGGRFRFQLPNIESPERADADLLMAPYALGAWLGDGTSTKPWITHAASDAAVIDGITACGYAPSKVYVHRTTGVHSTAFAGPRPNVPSLFWKHLRALDLVVGNRVGNKHIPEAYFNASVNQRLELLAGIVDTDGHVDRKGRVTISTCMPQLAEDIERLVRELGMRPYTHVVPPTTSTSGIVGRQDVYTVGFQPTRNIPTRLLRKATLRIAEQRRVAVTAVRQAAPERGRCIQVEASDGLYLAGRNLTPTHNSQLASDMFPSWILGKHPEWSVIGSSYAQSLPISFSRAIRDRLAVPEFKAMFPDTQIRKDASGVEEWKTTKGGGYKAAGVGVGLTGFGGDILIADDLIKDAEEASSEVIRENTYQWYQTVFRTRLAPGGGILLIGTRWHWHDPAGRALELDEQLKKAGVPDYEREGWEVVSYPAIAETDEFLLKDGSIAQGVYEDDMDDVLRLLRRKGEALHPERYPLGELLKIKNTTTSANWSALYQQNPTPDEGDFFLRDDFRYRWLDPAYRPLCRIFMTVDYAIGKKERNDFTVAGVFALDSNDDLYCLEIRRGRWGTNEIVSNVTAMVMAHRVELYAGEQGAIHHAVWPLIANELGAPHNRKYVSVDETLTPIQDKETRARPLQGRMQRHKLFFSFDNATRPEIYDITEREMLQFPNGAHDDIVDMLAWAGRLALNISLPSMQRVPERQKSWTDKLRGGSDSRDFMAA